MSLLLNNSLPPHLQMLGTAPSFFFFLEANEGGAWLDLGCQGHGQGVGRTMQQELELGSGERADRGSPVERQSPTFPLILDLGYVPPQSNHTAEIQGHKLSFNFGNWQGWRDL